MLTGGSTISLTLLKVEMVDGPQTTVEPLYNGHHWEPSLVPRPRPAFRRLQYGKAYRTNSDGKLGGAWERGYWEPTFCPLQKGVPNSGFRYISGRRGTA